MINSKVLGEIGMCPPALSRMNVTISENYFNYEKNKDQEIKALLYNTKGIESGFYLEMDNENESRKINES